jgi:hypothetical protein
MFQERMLLWSKNSSLLMKHSRTGRMQTENLTYSSPTPLCPLFLPGRWNREVVGDCAFVDSDPSPNLEKKPFFFVCCFACSSFKPTSSKPSSAVGGCLSNRRSPMAERGSLCIRAESKLCRPKDSWGITGDFAEMSCINS